MRFMGFMTMCKPFAVLIDKTRQGEASTQFIVAQIVSERVKEQCQFISYILQIANGRAFCGETYVWSNVSAVDTRLITIYLVCQ